MTVWRTFLLKVNSTRHVDPEIGNLQARYLHLSDKNHYGNCFRTTLDLFSVFWVDFKVLLPLTVKRGGGCPMGQLKVLICPKRPPPPQTASFITYKLPLMFVLSMIPTENVFSTEFILSWSYSFSAINKTRLKLVLFKYSKFLSRLNGRNEGSHQNTNILVNKCSISAEIKWF